MRASAQKQVGTDTGSSLRDRKKALRREEILTQASALFAQKGIDATTMAEIAEAVGVTAPTIFNYFGNKDGILIALITEGAQKARAIDHVEMVHLDSDFATILVDLFAHFAERTLQIASKRIWRYAEAAAIRHPKTDLAREYITVDEELLQVVVAFFDRFDIQLRSGRTPDTRYLASLYFDVWNTTFFKLIKTDGFGLAQHREDLRARFVPLSRMLFDDDFLNSPTLKAESPAHANC